MKYTLNPRLEDIQELRNVYGLRIFGKLDITNKKKKRFFSSVDNWIEKKLNKDRLPLEEQKKLLITNVVMTCKKENVKQVFVTSSTQLKDGYTAIVQEILRGLQASGIETAFGECITCKAESLAQMGDMTKVIFVEQAGVTRYSSLENEMVLCADQSVEILGAVVLS